MQGSLHRICPSPSTLQTSCGVCGEGRDVRCTLLGVCSQHATGERIRLCIAYKFHRISVLSHTGTAYHSDSLAGKAQKYRASLVKQQCEDRLCWEGGVPQQTVCCISDAVYSRMTSPASDCLIMCRIPASLLKSTYLTMLLQKPSAVLSATTDQGLHKGTIVRSGVKQPVMTLHSFAFPLASN